MGIKIETVGSSSSRFGGGLVPTEIYVGYKSKLTTIEKPADITTAPNVESLVTITGDHVWEAGYGFTKFHALIERSAFECSFIGEKKFRLFENKVTIILKGSSATTLGALTALNGQDLIVLFKEAGSKQYRQIGHEDYPADLSEGGNTIAETYEGENITTFVFMDKAEYPAPIYSGERTVQPAA